MNAVDESKVKKWNIYGALFTMIMGTLLHFAYEWSGNNPVVGIFVAVNESTFEHLKLFFWPFVIFMVAEYVAYGKNTPYFFPSKAVAVFAGMFFITSAFYTYSGVLGFDVTFIDIAIFYISVVAAYVISYKRLINKKNLWGTDTGLPGYFLIILMCAAFVALSFYTPELGIFEPPAQ